MGHTLFIFYDRPVPNLRWKFFGDSEPADRGAAAGAHRRKGQGRAELAQPRDQRAADGAARGGRGPLDASHEPRGGRDRYQHPRLPVPVLVHLPVSQGRHHLPANVPRNEDRSRAEETARHPTEAPK
eukprot:654380-Prorocentrum_minimum.AAC.2